MAEYTLTNKAVADISDIWNYTCENWSEQQADKYYAMLLDCCKKVAMKPQSGISYDDIFPGLLG